MDSFEEARVNEVAQAILRYLRAHPGSKDSLDGIRTCWLAGAEVDASETEVGRAVDRLLERRALKKERRTDGGGVFGAAGPEREPS